MNNLDKQYQELVKTILDYGISKGDRTGTGTKSIFGYTIRHNMKEGFPLLTTKKMAIKALMTELKWFLKGDTNIKYLVENNCNIWNGDAYRHYQFMNALATDIDFIPMDEFVDKIKTDDEFCEMYGELGPVYGKQWRKWDKYDHQLIDKESFPNVKSSVDQIANLIEQLKTNPDSRRLMVNAWNVGELDQMVLPPCHYGFQCYVRDGKYLSLMWNQRSVDTFLGLPFNIASYGLLLTILAKEVNMVPDQLIGNLGDTHLYLNHIEQAKEQIGREPFELPTLNPFPTYEGSRPSIESYVVSDFTLKDYQSHETIKAPLSN